MKTRVISAAVLMTIAGLCFFISPITRVLFFTAASVLCAYELSNNLKKVGITCCSWVMYLYICVQTLLTLFHFHLFAYSVCFVGAVYLALLSGVLHKEVSGKGALMTVAGLAYPCMLFSILMCISISDFWLDTFIIGCISTWVCDSFALFGGTRFGKHKLAPLVSPHKTVEGCLCGAISSVGAGFAIYFIFLRSSVYPMWVVVLTALLASTLGQIGDLAESLVKRMIGVKDFSNLIPGHGGMFDRADSLLFSIPTAYCCLLITRIVLKV